MQQAVREEEMRLGWAMFCEEDKAREMALAGRDHRTSVQ